MKIGETQVILAAHVDDLIILAENDTEMEEIMKILKAEFTITDMGSYSIMLDLTSSRINNMVDRGSIKSSISVK